MRMTAVTVQDVVFTTSHDPALAGRLYRPAASGPVPLLVDIHGGAWNKGDRLNNQVMHQYLAEHGIATFALDFRLAPATQYPGAVRDVNQGIRWVKAHAEELGTRADWVGGLGTSSGGHLLMLNTLLPDHPDHAMPDAGADARVNYAVVCWGILDPLARYRMAQARNLTQLISAHHDFWPDEAAMTRANPQLILERGEHAHLPPAIIIQGIGDQNVDHARADLFADAYRKAGGDVAVHKFDDVHMFVTSTPDTDNSRQALERIRDFVLAQTVAVR
jgi:acetyl esterase/lipase